MACKNCILGILCSALIQVAPLWSATWDLPATDLTTMPPDPEARAPVIGIDGAGNTTAIWYFDVGASQSYIVAESKPVGGSWSGVRTTISVNAPNTIVRTPQMSMNNAGEAHAVWIVEDTITNDTHIQANTMRAFGVWQTPNGTNISDASAGKSANEPQIGINASGGGVAVWQFSGDPSGLPRYIQAARVDSYGNWLSPTDLSDNSNPSSSAVSPKVAVNSAGAAVAVWSFDDGGGSMYIQASRMTSLGVWDLVATNLAGPLPDLQQPFVAMNDNGEAVAVWVEGVLPSGTIHVSNMTSGGVWSASQLLSDGGLHSDTPLVALDSNGNAVAVWRSADNPTTFSQTRGATQLAGQSWTPVGGDVISDTLTSGTAQNGIGLDIDNSGRAVVAWIGVVLPPVPLFPSLVFGATKPFGASWDSPTTLSAAGQSIDSLGLDVNGNGDIAVDWGLSFPTFIIQATGASEVPPVPPSSISSATGKQVAVRFAMQTEYVNQLKWAASSGSVAGYRIYRNGVLLLQIPSDQLHYEDQFQRKKERVSYGITAVGNDGIETSPTIVIIN